MNRPISVAFITQSLKTDFEILGEGKSEDKRLRADLIRAFDSLRADVSAGAKIQKRLWPKFYKKRHLLTNLWKLDLQDGWRLIYTIKIEEDRFICTILEWLPHKEYEKRFGY